VFPPGSRVARGVSNINSMKTSVRILVLVVLTALLAVRAQAQFTISSLPITITTPGTYTLTKNLSYNGATGNAITINAGSVTIDFAGFGINGLGAGTATQANGIYAFNRSTLTIRNGQIAGFRYGITLDGSFNANANNTGNVIENMRLTYNTYMGILTVKARANRISDCIVSNTGRSPAGAVIVASAYGIYCEGLNAGAINVIKENQVSGTGDKVAEYPFGISATFSVVLNNQVSDAYYGVYATSSKYRDNITMDCTVPFSGGTNLGGNN